MPQAPDWKRVLETGMQFTELRRSQARRVAADLVTQGQLARDQMAGAVDEIVALSRKRSEEMRDMIRTEVQRQLSGLGLATKDDLARLERKLGAVARKSAPAKKAGTTKSAAAKKTVKKAAAKKAG